MSYESWRISYQSSEQAARAAYTENQRLAAALEAAREDAERYRWLRRDAVFAGWSMPRQPIPCPDRIAWCMVAHSSWELSGAALDAAIDQARGKGGKEDSND